MEHPDAVMNFVRCNAQEMEDEVMLKHIHLYVNNFTLNLGPDGRKAIARLFELAHESRFVMNKA
jgi:1,4-dihydroxy-6-naphthoate synthase